MATIDIILTILLLTGAVRGFIRGFVYEIALLGVVFVLYFFGFKLADYAGVYVAKWIEASPSTVHYISLFAVWIGISIALIFLAKLIEGLINVAALGIFNKFAGAFFGVIKYAFLLSVFLYFFNKIDFSTKWLNPDKKAESMLYYPILKFAPIIVSALK